MMAASGRKVYCVVNSCVVLQFIFGYVFVLIHLMSVISKTVSVRLIVNPYPANVENMVSS